MITPRSEVFCDFFTLTTPKENHAALIAALQPFFAELGCTHDRNGYGYRSTSNGLFSWRERHAVAVYTASGSFLSDLRDHSLLNHFLAELALFPHRVSSADFTVDEYVFSPPRLSQIYELGVSGSLSFTRKAISRSHVRSLLTPAAYPNNSNYRDTGTLYIGTKGSHEVYAKVYDKRQELLAKHGVTICDTLRHELTVSHRMGITLRDVSLPTSCFYHFYPPELLPTAQCDRWAPMAEGYTLPKLPERLPAQLLKQRVEGSKDLQDMFELADKVGIEGLTYLLTVVKSAYQRRQNAAMSCAA